MNRLILVRHGITAWNANGRYQGQTDIPLNEEGLQQAQVTRERLRSEQFTACYTSALSRARVTAEVILEAHRCPISETPELNEMNYGDWEGLTRAEILEHYADNWKDMLADPLHVAPSNGESRLELQQRVARVITAIEREHRNACLLIVSHGGTIRAIVSHYLRLPGVEARRLRLDNTGISVVDSFDGDGILALFNDTAHLGFEKPLLARLPAH